MFCFLCDCFLYDFLESLSGNYLYLFLVFRLFWIVSLIPVFEFLAEISSFMSLPECFIEPTMVSQEITKRLWRGFPSSGLGCLHGMQTVHICISATLLNVE